MSDLAGVLARYATLGLLAALALGCAYRGEIDQPLTVEVTWYSYINGDDLRAACEPGAPDRYRLIYNADYEKHLRSYELYGLSDGSAWMITRVQDGAPVGVRRTLFGGNPFNPANWQRSEGQLPAEQFAALEQAFAASGAYDPPPTGLRVYSDQYYWVATSCRDGVFAFNVWRYPSERYDRLAFPDLLFAEDESGVAVAPPLEVSPAARMKGERRGEKPSGIFEFYVGESGFEGHLKI